MPSHPESPSPPWHPRLILAILLARSTRGGEVPYAICQRRRGQEPVIRVSGPSPEEQGTDHRYPSWKTLCADPAALRARFGGVGVERACPETTRPSPGRGCGCPLRLPIGAVRSWSSLCPRYYQRPGPGDQPLRHWNDVGLRYPSTVRISNILAVDKKLIKSSGSAGAFMRRPPLDGWRRRPSGSRRR